MKRKILAGLITGLAMTTAHGAFAGDYNSGVVTKGPSPEYTQVEYGSGWYLRGDITFNLDGEHEAGSQYIAALDATLDYDYEDVLGIQVGFGYIFNPHFRMDITAEATLDSEFDGTVAVTFDGLEAVTDPATGVTTTTAVDYVPGTETIQASYNSTNLMVNGYFDLPTHGRFTPYIGGGVGVARVELNERRTVTCTPLNNVGTVVQTCGPPAPGAAGVTVADVEVVDRTSTEYLFAYQVAVGTAYQLTDNLALDVGYTYFSTGDGVDLDYSDGTAIDRDGFTTHKVKAGLRYDIW